MHKIKLLLLCPIFFITVSTSTTRAEGTPDVLVTDVWISKAPPSVETLAAYATLENQSNVVKVLNKASSPFFSKIEFHLSRLEKDMFRMEKQKSLSIEPKSRFAFSPGQYHLMLFKPHSPLQIGDKVPLLFHFTDGTRVAVEASVLQRKENQHSSTHHHHQ